MAEMLQRNFVVLLLLQVPSRYALVIRDTKGLCCFLRVSLSIFWFNDMTVNENGKGYPAKICF